MSCLGPYNITSLSLTNNGDNTFTDNTRTKLIAAVSECNTVPELPCKDAILLHSSLGCQNNSCDIYYYECPSIYGRIYTILATACDVVITSFENGLFVNGTCDRSQYGTSKFCFGKVYSGEHEHPISQCKTTFEYDSHIFQVSAHPSIDFGLFDCSHCGQKTSLFGEGKGELPDAPTDIDPVATKDDTDIAAATTTESLITWNDTLSEKTNNYILCDAERSIDTKTKCQSQDNPSVTTLPSGHILIAYEFRRSDGITGIKLSIVSSTINNKLYYYRSLSFGRLLNNNSVVYGSGTFEIYDDILFDTDENNQLTQTLFLGFLSGPLSGGDALPIQSAQRAEDSNGRAKWIIGFSLQDREPVFESTNDAYNVQFFIMENAQKQPGGDNGSVLIEIPQHKNSVGQEISMSIPSISVAKNHLMIDETQNIFLTYQAWDDMWNVYLMQIRLGERATSSPVYKQPYLFTSSDCLQTYVIDDNNCPSPYLAFTYKPEDLYVIKTNTGYATRIKYHMSVNSAHEPTDQLDVMFIVDYSSSMSGHIQSIKEQLAILTSGLASADLSTRYGLTVFGRNNTGDPNAVTCTGCYPGSTVFSGLWNISSSGFTDNVSYLQTALEISSDGVGPEPGYSAIYYALTNSQFEWRPKAKKVIVLITDTTDQVGTCIENPNLQSAVNNLVQQYGVAVGLVINTVGNSTGCIGAGTGYIGMLDFASPSLGSFDITSPFREIFDALLTGLLESSSNARIIERDTNGYGSTFLKNAEILLTYDSDLLDMWTNDKNSFIFVDNAPVSNAKNYGLTNVPFPLIDYNVYGINPVHVIGDINNWVFFSGPGQLNYEYPDIGVASSESIGPILIASNSARARVKLNNRNDVFIIYENYATNVPQINIKGTGDFYQNSITGPKSKRLTKFYTASDFAWSHSITDIDMRVNQLCDFAIDNNDVVHIVWQSNTHNYWEIYYANSYDLFTPVRLTQSNSRSAMPRIDISKSGKIYVVYHDNRFGPYEVMLSFKDEKRVLPLIEQDAYLASFRSGYKHYTNILPFVVSNPLTASPSPGSMWATKTASGIGNWDENFIFEVTTTPFGKSNGCNTSPFEIIALAGSRSGYLYGITSGNKILQLDDPQQDVYGDTFCSGMRQQSTLELSNSYLGSIILEDDFDGSSLDTSKWVERDLIYNHCGPFSKYLAKVTGGHLTLDNSIVGSPAFAIVGYSIANVIAITATSFRVSARIKWQTGTSSTDRKPLFYIAASYLFIAFEPDIIRIGRIVNVSCGTQEMYGSIYELDISGTGLIPENSWVDIDVYFLTVTPGQYTVKVSIEGAEQINITRYEHIALDTLIFSSVSYNFASTGIFQTDSIVIREINPSGSITTNVLDASFDNTNRLWILTGEQLASLDYALRLTYIDIATGGNIADQLIYTASNLDITHGGITVLNDGSFILARATNDGVTTFLRSSYPIVSGETASFDFTLIGTTSYIIEAITSDYADTIFAVDNRSILYSVNTQSFGLTTIGDFKIPDDPAHPYLSFDPVGDVSALSYKFNTNSLTSGSDDRFHVLIEFYDNIGLSGSPTVTVDSRSNLESFVNVVTAENPYTDVVFDSADGVFLPSGQSAIVYFDASHFRPGIKYLSYPYGFDTNHTYFPKLFIIASDGSITPISNTQAISFSCNRCSVYGSNASDAHACSVSFVASDDGQYNFIIDIAADENYTNIIRTYKAIPNHSNLQYFQVNNQAAVLHWTQEGLIVGDKSAFIQLYPSLDQDSGLMCGIRYFVRIWRCNNSGAITGIFNEQIMLCECFSTIYGGSRLQPLDNIPRWHSSAFGYSDTRVTDSTSYKTRPTVHCKDDSAIILFQDESKIRGAKFIPTEPNQLFGSGSRSWFNYDFGTIGKNHESVLDIYGRINTVYEQKTAVVDGLPENKLSIRACDFATDILTEQTKKECDTRSLTDNIITTDVFILQSLVKKIIVAPKHVMYYTYNSSGIATPVVSECEIELHIWGTPEIVAYRMRNENQTIWNNWCAFSPEISEYYTEVKWKLSVDSGIKEICTQFMTYNGITVESCIPVIADYPNKAFSIKMYTDSEYSVSLPSYNNVLVASTLFDKQTGSANNNATVYIDIFINHSTNAENINFDVIQQGVNDIYGLVATKNAMTGSFRGSFQIEKEDTINNIDGLAVIKPSLPDGCHKGSFATTAPGFIKEDFNLMSQSSISQNEENVLNQYRQDVSGFIGVGMTIRPDEDPYLIFGTPDFFLNIQEQR